MKTKGWNGDSAFAKRLRRREQIHLWRNRKASGVQKHQQRTRWLLNFCVCLLAVVLLLGGCQSKSTPPGTVMKIERVVSGQTVEVVGIGEQPALIEQVRLIGIEAPDLRQRPWGLDAKKRLEEMIAGQPIRLELGTEPEDSFERKLAYVWKDEKLLNEQMLAEGYALFQPRSLNTKYNNRLERAQEWARLMGLGIWNPDKPMRQTPAEFRSQNR